MQIYIMRHGQAEMTAYSDAERNLTKLGKQESELMAKHLAAQNVSLDAVLVSPYIRAQQTWQAVHPFFSEVKDIQTLAFLKPNGSARRAVNELLALQAQGAQHVLIISHLPLVGYIVGELAPAAGVPAFLTSAMAHISVDEVTAFATLLSLTTVSQLLK